MSEIRTDTTLEPKLDSSNLTFHRNDPHSFLPLNSDLPPEYIPKTLAELEIHFKEEKREMQKIQKQVALWEDRIRGNYFQMGKNVEHIKSNEIEADYDTLNRDYWWNRESLVLTDLSLAKSTARPSDWSWIIKKYGLKNTDGTLLDPHAHCIEELCLGAIRNLAIEYKEVGVRFDLALNYKKSENEHVTSINAKLSATNEHLRNYMNHVQTKGIEPIQDGILFFQEFALKLKSLENQEKAATYGELRAWAEEHLDQFLKKYPSIPDRFISNFRRLALIPLPAKTHNLEGNL